MKRGEVVIVDFSFYDPTDKVRPALVVQNQRDNKRMKRTIVAVITGNIRRSAEDSQYLIDHAKKRCQEPFFYVLLQPRIERIVGLAAG